MTVAVDVHDEKEAFFTEDAPLRGYHWLRSNGYMNFDMKHLAPKIGETVSVKGPLKLCVWGLHASQFAIKALLNAPGTTFCWVSSWGDTVFDYHKHATTHRRIDRMVQADDVLEAFISQLFIFLVDVLDLRDDDRRLLLEVPKAYFAARHAYTEEMGKYGIGWRDNVEIKHKYPVWDEYEAYFERVRAHVLSAVWMLAGMSDDRLHIVAQHAIENFPDIVDDRYIIDYRQRYRPATTDKDSGAQALTVEPPTKPMLSKLHGIDLEHVLLPMLHEAADKADAQRTADHIP